MNLEEIDTPIFANDEMKGTCDSCRTKHKCLRKDTTPNYGRIINPDGNGERILRTILCTCGQTVDMYSVFYQSYIVYSRRYASIVYQCCDYFPLGGRIRVSAFVAQRINDVIENHAKVSAGILADYIEEHPNAVQGESKTITILLEWLRSIFNEVE